MNKNSDEYESLLRWVVQYLKRLNKHELQRRGSGYLRVTVERLDSFDIINSESDFREFQKDVEDILCYELEDTDYDY